MPKEKKSVRLPPALIRYIDLRRKTNKINFSQQVSWMMCISAIGFFEHSCPELKGRCKRIMKKIISTVKRPIGKDDVKWVCNEMRWLVDYMEKKKQGRCS